MARFVRTALVLFACLALVPVTASAQQASITGVARDASGAVLPGVTVEASSPALIEGVRSAVTDGTGRYRIEALRPGDYVITFMLAGFPAGLVIYWAWSNLLSILQQSVIMRRHGVDIDLLGNIRESLPFLKKKTAAT